MENKKNIIIEKKENSEIKISESIKRAKTYLFKYLRKSINTNELEKNKKEEENNLKNKIKSYNNINKQKLMQEFKDSCFKIILTNHLEGDHKK
jgi:hypothetical protein